MSYFLFGCENSDILAILPVMFHSFSEALMSFVAEYLEK